MLRTVVVTILTLIMPGLAGCGRPAPTQESPTSPSAEPPALKPVAEGPRKVLSDTAEAKWAKAIAVEFLDALIVEHSGKAASATLSDGFKKRIGAGLIYLIARSYGTAEEKARGYLESEFHEHLRTWGSTWASYGIESQEMAPDLGEALFRGPLRVNERVKSSYTSGTFTLRVSKEKESGKWRVDNFSVKGSE
jgi:hypothetical protein